MSAPPSKQVSNAATTGDSQAPTAGQDSPLRSDNGSDRSNDEGDFEGEEEEEEESDCSSELSGDELFDTDGNVVPIQTYTTAEAAVAARKEGVDLFNAGELNRALAVQVGILICLAKHWGESSPKMGLYLLDYGVSLHQCVMLENAAAAALAGNDGQDNQQIGTCFANLKGALQAFEAEEAETTDEARLKELTVLQAEAHDILGQLNGERDDPASAAKELEMALMLRRDALPAHHRLIIATLYSLAASYFDMEEYQTAAEKSQEAIDLATSPAAMAEDPRNRIDDELIDDLKTRLEDARDMAKQGGAEKMRKEIRELYPEEDSIVRMPEEDDVSQALSQGEHMSGIGDGILNATSADAITNSMPGIPPYGEASAGPSFVPMPPNENSVSIFPMQFADGTMSAQQTDEGSQSQGVINRNVAIKKKARKPKTTRVVDADDDGEAPLKKQREE